MKNQNCSFHIHELRLPVYLGWPTAERKKKQTVLLSLAVDYAKPPKACQTDQLSDTVCYDQLIVEVKKHVGNHHYRLVEFLARDIYAVVKPSLPTTSTLTVCIKKYPSIKNLSGGVSFYFGDQSQ